MSLSLTPLFVTQDREGDIWFSVTPPIQTLPSKPTPQPSLWPIQDRGGDVRCGVQGAGEGHQPDRGSEEAQDGEGKGGLPHHVAQGGQHTAQGKIGHGLRGYE